MDQKIVVITGSESGIGRASTNLLLSYGYLVIGADIKKNNNPFADNHSYIFVRTDVTDINQINYLFNLVKEDYGRIDVLLNCAGITSLDGVDDITSEKWDTMLNINLKAVFFCCQQALKIMSGQRYGKIVNISSNAGIGGGKAVGVHYSTSKAGIIGLTKSLALYAADFNVNVNCVAPGPTQTPMTEEWEKEVNERLKEVIPLKRFGEPEEIAEAIIFLSSEKSNFITGETLNVNGGILMD